MMVSSLLNLKLDRARYIEELKKYLSRNRQSTVEICMMCRVIVEIDNDILDIESKNKEEKGLLR